MQCEVAQLIQVSFSSSITVHLVVDEPHVELSVQCDLLWVMQ